MLRAAWTICALVLSQSLASAQTPVPVGPLAECEVDLPHETINTLNEQYLNGQWRELQDQLGGIHQRIFVQCVTVMHLDAPTLDDVVLFTWVGAGADGKRRLHSAFHPNRRPYELVILDPGSGSGEYYYEVFLTDRRGLKVVSRQTSERKDDPLAASATTFVSSSAGQIATAAAAAALGLSTSVPSRADALGPAPSTPLVGAAALGTGSDGAATFAAASKPASGILTVQLTPGPQKDEKALRPVLIASIRRVTLPDHFGTVKAARKIVQPQLPAELSTNFAEFVTPVQRRWTKVEPVQAYLQGVTAVVSEAPKSCQNQDVDTCRRILLESVATKYPRSSMPPDVAAVDVQVRGYLADLTPAAFEDDLTLRNEATSLVGFTTVVGFTFWKDEGANNRIKATGADNTPAFDPLPNVVVGFGVSTSLQRYSKALHDLTLRQRIRLSTGVVVTPNLGAFVTAGYVVLPRLSLVAGGSILRVPLDVTADKRDFIRGRGAIAFLGTQVEFP